MTRYEVVTLGRRIGFPERNNTRYHITDTKPTKKLGDKWKDGDYEIELIYIKEL